MGGFRKAFDRVGKKYFVMYNDNDKRWDHLFNDIPKALEKNIPERFISSFSTSGIPNELKAIRDSTENGRWGERKDKDPNNDSYAKALTEFRNFLNSYDSSKKAGINEVVKKLFVSSYDTNVAKYCDNQGKKREIWMSFVPRVVDVIANHSGF